MRTIVPSEHPVVVRSLAGAQRHLNLQPARATKLISAINQWGLVIDAVQRLVLQVLGTIALIHLVVRVILR